MITQKGGQNIPIRVEPGTFEQFQRSIVDNLEQNYHTPTSKRPVSTQKPPGSASTVPVKISNADPHLRSHDWRNQVNLWTNLCNRLWSDDMRRIWDNAFVLAPADEFDLDPFKSYGPLGCFGPGGDVPSILAKMSRQLQALDALEALQRQSEAGQHAGSAVQRRDSDPARMLDFLRDAYELDADGRVHFKVRFDVRNFTPEDIKVTASKNRLNVHGKKVEKSDVSESVNEFCRTLYLPDDLDHDEIRCHFTDDGILTVEAPVKGAEYQFITFDKNHQLGIRPRHEGQTEAVAENHENKEKAIVPLKASGTFGPVVVHDPSGGGSKIHVEFPVESHYDPENLCVRVDGDRITLTGKHEVTDRTSENESVHIREFTRSYKIPASVDPLTVKAQMDGDTLVVEAPVIGGKAN
ncbi:unnamed protein product [Calicophoron daubneyi]|uniref:SHSP domain-containing protein n=1 Tax=Calicophoron daubneyi TaxID=300641 RepID=A0AAV2T9P2_CALDB